MKKHKAIAIPVCLSSGTPTFLTVKDKRFKEWIFVTGGCNNREIFHPLRCAIRELEEETRGVVVLRHGEYTSFSFTVKESYSVVLEYTVFILFVNYTRSEQAELVQRFNDEKHKMRTKQIRMKRTYDENDFMSFDTLSEFNTRKRWDLIINNVLMNPEFYTCVSSLNRKKFIIK